jgi:hypothetical protein
MKSRGLPTKMIDAMQTITVPRKLTPERVAELREFWESNWRGIPPSPRSQPIIQETAPVDPVRCDLGSARHAGTG